VFVVFLPFFTVFKTKTWVPEAWPRPWTLSSPFLPPHLPPAFSSFLLVAELAHLAYLLCTYHICVRSLSPPFSHLGPHLDSQPVTLHVISHDVHMNCFFWALVCNSIFLSFSHAFLFPLELHPSPPFPITKLSTGWNENCKPSRVPPPRPCVLL